MSHGSCRYKVFCDLSKLFFGILTSCFSYFVADRLPCLLVAGPEREYVVTVFFHLLFFFFVVLVLLLCLRQVFAEEVKMIRPLFRGFGVKSLFLIIVRIFPTFAFGADMSRTPEVVIPRLMEVGFDLAFFICPLILHVVALGSLAVDLL